MFRENQDMRCFPNGGEVIAEKTFVRDFSDEVSDFPSDLICEAVCSSSISWVVCLLPSLSNLIAEGDLLNDIRRKFSVVTINEFRSGGQINCCEDGTVELRNGFVNIFDALDVGVPWERGAPNLLKFRPISRFNNLAYGWKVDININFERDWIVVTAKSVDRILITEEKFLRIPKSRVLGLLEWLGKCVGSQGAKRMRLLLQM
ncbi:hypothetical protein AVEN_44112-1 [Araneus ventricosus]|uniref:Uncharacterized protein n=1 Tax=Araneus ventricosus TaxID=182803 RepID=A0A4Y2DAV6_ARAVE|nr:hypothetical protein AVEN_44112-1 [Araneus ventricosus]